MIKEIKRLAEIDLRDLPFGSHVFKLGQYRITIDRRKRSKPVMIKEVIDGKVKYTYPKK